ncbi:MAG: hypothetical protein SNJ64_03015, partial [Endomicrobiia bacterium]
MTKKLFLIDETGDFTSKNIEKSYVFCTLFYDKGIDEINNMVNNFLIAKGLEIENLHGCEMSDDLKKEFYCYVTNQIGNNITILKTDTNYEMRYSDDQNYMIALEAMLKELAISYIDNNDNVTILIAQRPYHVRYYKGSKPIQTTEEKSNYKQSMEKNNIEKIKEKIKKCRPNIELNIFLSNYTKKDYISLCVPDIFCAMYRKDDVKEINIEEVNLKLEKFRENYIRYDKAYAYSEEILDMLFSDKEVEEKNIQSLKKYLTSKDVNIRNLVLTSIVNRIISQSDTKVNKNYEKIIEIFSTNNIESNIVKFLIESKIYKNTPILEDSCHIINCDQYLNELTNNIFDKIKLEI